MVSANEGIKKPEKTPIKRHDALKPLSREHHHGLLFCWKIRTGLQRGISIERIKKYSNSFFDESLTQHFEIEEHLIFPLISESYPEIIEQALNDHAILRKLFANDEASSISLQALANKLNDHIRFEERVLFKKIQETVNDAELTKIVLIHDKKAAKENYPDAFWL